MLESSLQARERILIAAQKLFATKGYEQVTVREIAKEANCSHTSIYLYYQDKRELLAQLAEEPLTKLIQQFECILSSGDSLARQKLIEIAIVYVKFGMLHRNLYQTFMTIEAGRVDEPGSDWRLSKLRQQIFALLQTSVSALFIQPEEDQILAFSRILFYQLHGTITTYANSAEDIALIEERVLPLVEMSITYLMKGVCVYEDK